MSDKDIINNHEKKLEILKIKLNDNDQVNQMSELKEKLLTEQNYLLEIYKIKNIKEKKIVSKKKYKSENKKRTKPKIVKKTELKEIEIKDVDPLTTKSFYYPNLESKIMTKYSKKIEKGNYIYYECNKRKNGCKRKCKYDKNKKKMVFS